MIKDTIGVTEKIDILGRKNVPAKIDTGADSSAIWASHIRVGRDGILRFRLFDEGSPYYTGKVIKRQDFKVVRITSSNGQSEIRYRTHFRTNINSRNIRILFNLADRSKNGFPVLIGRRSIKGKFLVDVSRGKVQLAKRKVSWSIKMQDNPYEFHKKYVKMKKERET